MRVAAAVHRVLLAVAAALPLATTIGGPVAAKPPLPPLDKQWHLDALRVAQAHRIATGEGVVVAVVDTGVYAGHRDLAGQVLDGENLLEPGDKGQVDDKNHGTPVAGVIAAKGGGAGHAYGIAPGAKILPVTVVLGGEFGGTNLDKGIRYAVDHGAKVINISAGGRKDTDRMREAIRYAQEKDVVVVASAGNAPQGDTDVLWPARLPGVLGVAATDRTGNAWSGNVRGSGIAISAPGVDIASTAGRWKDRRVGGYLTADGTSVAAPMVAGAAALIRSKFPEMSAADVVNRLVRTARDAGPPGRDDRYGFGQLDLVAALTADVPSVTENPLGVIPPPDMSAYEPVDGGLLDVSTGRLIAVVTGVTGVAGLVLAVVVLLVVRRGRIRPAANPANAALPGYRVPPSPNSSRPLGHSAGPPGYPTAPPPHPVPPSGQSVPPSG